MTPHKQAQLMTNDELIQKASAFQSFEDFMHSVNAHEYVPTVHVQGLRKVTPSQRLYQAAKNELALRLKSMNVDFWCGNRYKYRGIN